MDADQAGMDWSPIHGPAAEAVPLAVARLTAIVKTLSDDKREIATGDVLYDDKADDAAATGTWYDYMTPNALMSGDGSPEVLMQFLARTHTQLLRQRRRPWPRASAASALAACTFRSCQPAQCA